MVSSIPKHIDRYEISELLGQGGQGSVYLARDPRENRFVALKLLSPLSSSEMARSRFRREFTAVARLNHPGIVKVFEQGEYENLPYFTMEFIKGKPIGNYISGNRRISLICHLMAQVADTLAYIHSMRMIHRDLKPGNILVEDDDRVRLTDFGLVKPQNVTTELTRTFAVLGTINYISPEALNNNEIEPRSDLYSFGIVLFELICGQTPFKSESLARLISMQMLSQPPEIKSLVPECPVELNDLCRKLLSKDPWNRPATAEIVAVTLNQIKNSLGSQPVSVTPASLKQGAPLYPKFTGREPEINQLISSLTHNMTVNQFTITIIRGESGIGKSRLIREAGIRVSKDKLKLLRIPVVPAGCSSYEAIEEFLAEVSEVAGKNIHHVTDLILLLQELYLLSHHFDRFKPAVPQDRKASIDDYAYQKPNLIRYFVRVFTRLTELNPWLLIIEDFQNLDTASIELFKELIHWSESHPVQCAVWASVRDDVFPEDSPAAGFLNTFLSHHSACRQINLARLKYNESCLLAASMVHQPQDSETVVKAAQLCNGQPLILVETIRGWASDGTLVPMHGGWVLNEPLAESMTLIPAPIKEILKKRLNVLTEYTLDTLFWAAALDPDIDFEILKYLDTDEESKILNRINTLILHKFIEVLKSEYGEKYRFQYAQMREILIEMMGPEETIKRHQDIVDVLQNQGKTNQYFQRIARHQEQAGQLTAAMRNWHEAGKEACQSENFRKAEDYFKRAENLTARIPPSKHRRIASLRIQNLFDLINAESAIGNIPQQEHYLEIIIPLLDPLKTPEFYTRIMMSKILVLHSRGFRKEAQELLSQLEKTVDLSQASFQSKLFSIKGFFALHSAQFKEAYDHYKKAFKLADPKDRYVFLWCLGKLSSELQRYRTAEKIFKYALEEYRKINHLSMQAKVYSSLGLISLVKGDTTQALKFLHEALKIHQTVGDEYWISCDQHDIGLIHNMRNEYELALVYFRDSQPYCYKNKLPRELIIGAMNYSQTLYRVGNIYQAYMESDKALKAAERTPLITLYLQVAFSMVNYLLLLGQSETAKKRLIEIVSNYKKTIQSEPDLTAAMRYALVHLAIVSGQITTARFLLNQISKTNDPALNDTSSTQAKKYYLTQIQFSLLVNNPSEIIRNLQDLIDCMSKSKNADSPKDILLFHRLKEYLENSNAQTWSLLEDAFSDLQNHPYFEYRIWLMFLLHWAAQAKGLTQESDKYSNWYLQLKQKNSVQWPDDFKDGYLENTLFIGDGD